MPTRHHEVTRIEGFSDAVFAFSLTLLVVSLEVPKSLESQLGPVFGIHDYPPAGDGRELMLLYSTGVLLIFGTFVLLYRHARSKRAELEFSPADEVARRFETRAHILSTSLGLASIAIALADRRLVPIAGFLYVLMGPLHAWNGTRHGRALRRLAAATPHHAKR